MARELSFEELVARRAFAHIVKAPETEVKVVPVPDMPEPTHLCVSDNGAEMHKGVVTTKPRGWLVEITGHEIGGEPQDLPKKKWSVGVKTS